MKALKFLLVVLLVVANFAFAKPSLADPPKFSKNPDYVTVTKQLDSLQALKKGQTQVENYTADEIDQKIADLEFQKYTLESGINWGQCRNETGKTLAVYGPKSKKSESSYDNALYFLADGQTTDPGWDCDGVFLPGDVQVAGLQGQESGTPLALKIVDGTQLVAKTNANNGSIEFNVPVSNVVKAGEVNWYIPNVSQSLVGTRVANVPTGEEND